MNITEFKKGDKVVRVEPAKSLGAFYNPFTMQNEERGGDRSYIGDKLTFIGVANGCAYFDREEGSFMSKVTETTKLDLRLDVFSDGWDYWQNIESIGDSNAETAIKFNLKEELKSAVAGENYELIAELKAIFDSAVAN